MSQQAEGKPSRYNRTFNGLVGSMIVTVILVVAFVGIRAFVYGGEETEVEPEDYLPVVEAVQDAGFSVAYPPTLPDGWIARSVDYEPGGRLDWGLAFLTEDGRFVGVRQRDDDLDDILADSLNGTAVEGDEVTVPSGVGAEWTTWTTDEGDRAYSTELGEEELVVYGSAPSADQEALIGLLTTEAYSAS